VLEQPVEGRELLVVTDSGLEVVYDILVLDILRTVAREVEGREASAVL
jgi:hypothetical protein